MKITAESELMKNQKHADVMSPDLAFDVLQTPEGDSIFFSIGTDHILYVTREVRSTTTGWTRVDLSTPLSASNGGAMIKAKTFALAQNPQTLHFDLALVVTVNGADSLYMSRNHANTVSEWSRAIQWLRVPFDADGVVAPSPLTIADAYMMTFPDADDPTNAGNLTCFVDIIRQPGDPLQLLDRYYIMPDTPTKWVRHALSIDLKAGTISSCLGHRTNDYVPGIYTCGLIENTRELIFTPQRNYFRPDSAPQPSRLILPNGTTAIASALDSNGDTNLFVSATNGLYLFPPDTQYDSASPTLIVPNVTIGGTNLFAGVTSLSAMTIGHKTVVTAVNTQGELFHVDCPYGSEMTPSSWSNPLPFATGVEGFAFYINKNASNIVLFAHLSGQTMLQFTQQPGGEWLKRSILLPATNIDDFVEYNSFTTHVIIRDDQGSPAPLVTVSITSETAVTAYVNNEYHVLTPEVPIHVHSDPTGALTVVQETETLAGVKMTAKIEGTSPTTFIVDPIEKISQKLQSIQSGNDLGNVKIAGADGKQKPLIPSDVPALTRDNAAEALKQLMKAKDAIAQKPAARASPAPGQPSQPVRVPMQPISLANSLAKSIRVAAEDFFNFFKRVWDRVTDFVVHLAEDVWHFIVKIGDSIYHAILDTVAAVVNAVEFVFNKIKVFFEDLIRWLGFLFDWDDIKRTHKVVKYVIKSRAQSFINSIDGLETSIDKFFMDMENKVNAWAGVTDPGQTIGLHQQASNSINAANGSNSPQSNWAVYHTQNGADAAQTKGAEKTTGQADTLMKIVNDLEQLALNEVDYVKTMISQIKEQVVDKVHEMTALQAFKKILAIATDLILKTARNVVVKLIDIFKIIARAMIDMLDAPIEIPILSSLYKRISGNDLSALDLICLVGAIPATIFFKIAASRAPFPDDASVQAIVSGSTGFSSGKIQPLPSVPKMGALSFKPVARQSISPAALDAGSHPQVGMLMKEKAPAAPQAKDPMDAVAATIDFLAGPGAILTIIFNAKKHATQKSGGAGEGGSDSEEKPAEPHPNAPPEPPNEKSPVMPKTVPNVEGSNGAAVPQAVPASVAGSGDVSFFIRASSVASYLLYIGPNYVAWNDPGSWPVLMNDVVTVISVFKTIADNTDKLCNKVPAWNSVISPIAECLINLIWLVPAIGGFVETQQKTDDGITMFAANCVFDLGGIISPGAAFLPEPADEIFWVAQQVLSGIYGALAVASGGLFIAEARKQGKL